MAPYAAERAASVAPDRLFAIGALIFSVPGSGAAPHPQEHLSVAERLTEFVVLIALMGAGLKLDRPLAFATSGPTWRLLGIAMPLTIGALALLGQALLGLNAAAAMLLAAAIAPTDPVLASDVQVGPPHQGLEDNVRFTLTSELHDGLAFPFVNLALAMALTTEGPWFRDWLLGDVIWKLSIGGAVGWIVGRFLGWLIFRLPNRAKLSRTGDGFVALGVTCLAYGLTELAHGYGFLAVFVAAVGIRSAERNHSYHEKLHDFVEQLERLFMMVLLVIFGGAIVGGGLLKALTMEAVLFALLAIFLVRPVSSWMSLYGGEQRRDENAVISFFGIRGLGSGYYLAYGLNHGKFENPDVLWSAAGLIILLWIILHGTTVTPAMRWLDRRSGRTSAADQIELDLDARA
jgi:NhaP-type Na+/H+ or K+/H+ antiporter